jgi:hypothetical protein
LCCWGAKKPAGTLPAGDARGLFLEVARALEVAGSEKAQLFLIK